MAAVVIGARIGLESDLIKTAGAIVFVRLYALLWIGGMVLAGFAALLAPVYYTVKQTDGPQAMEY